MCTTKGKYGQKNKFSVGKNVKWDPLIDPSKILMPPLHIKLGSSNNLLKLLTGIQRPLNIYKTSKLSEAKIKADVFIGLQNIGILEFWLKKNIGVH